MISKLPTRERMTVSAFHYKRVVLFYKMKRLLCVLYPYTGGGRHNIIWYFLPRFKIFDIQYYANTEFSKLMEYYNIFLLTFFVLQSYSLHDGSFNNPNL